MAKRLANVDTSRCVACGVCRLQCPKEAITIYKGCYAMVDSEKCVGCGRCVEECPASVIQLKEG